MGKIIKPEQIEELVKTLKRSKEKIILAGGCFDILHPGHIEFLQRSKKLGGTLIILLESDKSIKKIKGIKRPINPQKERAVILANLNMVDYVILLPLMEKDQDYFQLVGKIKPDIITITQNDHNKEKKLRQAKAVNAKLVTVMKRRGKYSTTRLLSLLDN